MERRPAPHHARRLLRNMDLHFIFMAVIGFGLILLVPGFPCWGTCLIFLLHTVVSIVIFVKFTRFHCPQCGQLLNSSDSIEPGQPLLFPCTTCQIEWESGIHRPSDD